MNLLDKKDLIYEWEAPGLQFENGLTKKIY